MSELPYPAWDEQCAVLLLVLNSATDW